MGEPLSLRIVLCRRLDEAGDRQRVGAFFLEQSVHDGIGDLLMALVGRMRAAHEVTEELTGCDLAGPFDHGRPCRKVDVADVDEQVLVTKRAGVGPVEVHDRGEDTHTLTDADHVDVSELKVLGRVVTTDTDDGGMIVDGTDVVDDTFPVLLDGHVTADDGEHQSGNDFRQSADDVSDTEDGGVCGSNVEVADGSGDGLESVTDDLSIQSVTCHRVFQDEEDVEQRGENDVVRAHTDGDEVRVRKHLSAECLHVGKLLLTLSGGTEQRVERLVGVSLALFVHTAVVRRVDDAVDIVGAQTLTGEGVPLAVVQAKLFRKETGVRTVGVREAPVMGRGGRVALREGHIEVVVDVDAEGVDLILGCAKHVTGGHGVTEMHVVLDVEALDGLEGILRKNDVFGGLFPIYCEGEQAYGSGAEHHDE